MSYTNSGTYTPISQDQYSNGATTESVNPNTLGGNYGVSGVANSNVTGNQGAQGTSTSQSQSQSQSQNQSQSESTSTPQNIYSSQSQLAEQIAGIAAQLGEYQYNWAQQQFANTSDITDANVNNYLGTGQTALQLANDNLNQYENIYQPENAQLAQEAGTYSSAPRTAYNIGSAESATAQAMNAGRINAETTLQSYGIDPSSGRYQELEDAQRAGAAAAEAGAGQEAELATQNTGRQLLQNSIAVGEQMPGQIVNSLNSAYQGIAGAENSALANVNTGVTAANSANSFLNTAESLKDPPVANTTQSQSASLGQSASASNSSSYAQHTGNTTGTGSGTTSGQNGANGTNGINSGGYNTNTGNSNNGTYGSGTNGSGTNGSGTNGSGTNGSGTSGSDTSGGSINTGGLGGSGGDITPNTSGSGVVDPATGILMNGSSSGTGINPISGSDSGGSTFTPISFGSEQNGQFVPSQGANETGNFGTTPSSSLGTGSNASSDNSGTSGDSSGNYSSGDTNQTPFVTDASGNTYNPSSGGGYGGYGGYAAGGVIPMTRGGGVPRQASPSMGQRTDDVRANLNAGEFVMPKDIVEWKGQEFFQKLIAQSRKARMTAPAHGKPSPPQGAMQRPMQARPPMQMGAR